MTPKVLLTITNGELGGAQQFVFDLACGLKQLGADIAVAVGPGEWLPTKLNGEQIPFFRLKHLARSHNPLANIMAIFEFKKLVKQNNFSVVHLNSSNALLLALGAKLAGRNIKTVFTFHGLSLLDNGYRASVLLKILYRLIFKLFLNWIDEPVFVCEANHRFALNHNVTKAGITIYNGPNPARLNFLPKEQSRQELNKLCPTLPANSFIIGSIGRLAYPKNYEFIIKLFPKILKERPNGYLIIIGDGPNKIAYQNLINSLNLQNRVWLLPAESEARRLIKGFDLFVLPSEFEGLSAVLIEAGLAGVPILASRVGGNAEVATNPQSSLYLVNDNADFLEKLRLYSAESPAPIAVQNKFSYEIMVASYIKLYEQ